MKSDGWLRRASVASGLGNRFDAIVFDWDGTAVPDREADVRAIGERVEALCSLACDVAVVSGTHAGSVDRRLAARPAGPGQLHLCVSGGAEVFQVTDAGIELVYRRTASATEERLLDRAAEEAMDRLRSCGLSVELVSRRLGRRKIDLIPLADWADPPKSRAAELRRAAEQGLRDCGIESFRAAVEIGLAAAHEAGLEGARVTCGARHIEIGLTDKADSARWIMGDLWRRGVGHGLVLVVGDEFGSPGGDSLLLVAEGSRATAVSVGVEPAGVPVGVTWLRGGPESFMRLLDEQLQLRRDRAVPRLDSDSGWTIAVSGLDPETERAVESRLCLADGRIGTAGSPLLAHQAAQRRVYAAGVYAGEGTASQLLACPNWNGISVPLGPGAKLDRVLDLRTGCLAQEVSDEGSQLRCFQFSSMARPGTAGMRLESSRAALAVTPPLEAPADAAGCQSGRGRRRRWMRIEGPVGGVSAAARDWYRRSGRSLERLAVFRTDPDTCPQRLEATTGLREAEAAGFERLLLEHRAAWARRWSEADITVQGDGPFQVALRFALFHLMGSVADVGEAVIGARGVSGPAYLGHVLWDTDVFVLPFLAATHAASARAMLEYRLRRLPEAMQAARALGRRGARFPWESARSGADVTPQSYRDQAGQQVAIRTGTLEEHIVADVAWAAATYWQWTGDQDFIGGRGRTLLVETARYWASRIRVEGDGTGHIYGVIGPDEYHEPVDDNAFTNVMARWNLKWAARLVADDPALSAEAAAWVSLAEILADGYDPETGLYEQFTGFWDLEPVIIRDTAPRRPVAADMLLGRDRVRGAQVVKQADVLMLHHLVPDEVLPDSLVPNLDFYEPRTAHGSSLSLGVHAGLLARAGRLEAAVEMSRLAARIDLDDITATTSGGLHLAVMGCLWQALVFGFAGLRAADGVLCLDPRLPPCWDGLGIPLRFRGTAVHLDIGPRDLVVESERPITLQLPGGRYVTAGRRPLRLTRTPAGWSEAGR
jgi:trehalose/maltose hydrolase-like predicted phosphorylase